MENVLKFLKRNPEIIFFIFAFFLWTALMCYENAKEGGDFKWHDLKVEANGMIFDLFVFGILVTAYNAIRARKEKIERLQEEIDDYRGWDEKEAMYRIVGAAKRLNNEGVTAILLYECFLSGANLSDADLSEANLSGANLSEAKLSETKLSKAYLSGANLTRADLTEADLTGANLTGANLTETNLLRAKLSGADLSGADLSGADLREANLSGADLSGANLSGANLTVTNLTAANLWRADLTKADLTKANLSETNLSEAPVGEDWFEKLEEWKVFGREKIIKRYRIDETGKLQLK